MSYSFGAALSPNSGIVGCIDDAPWHAPAARCIVDAPYGVGPAVSFLLATRLMAWAKYLVGYATCVVLASGDDNDQGFSVCACGGFDGGGGGCVFAGWAGGRE